MREQRTKNKLGTGRLFCPVLACILSVCANNVNGNRAPGFSYEKLESKLTASDSNSKEKEKISDKNIKKRHTGSFKNFFSNHLCDVSLGDLLKFGIPAGSVISLSTALSYVFKSKNGDVPTIKPNPEPEPTPTDGRDDPLNDKKSQNKTLLPSIAKYLVIALVLFFVIYLPLRYYAKSSV